MFFVFGFIDTDRNRRRRSTRSTKNRNIAAKESEDRDHVQDQDRAVTTVESTIAANGVIQNRRAKNIAIPMTDLVKHFSSDVSIDCDHDELCILYSNKI